MTQVQVQGNSVYFIKKYVLDRYGPELYEKILRGVSQEVYDILQKPLLANANYPLRTKDELLTHLLKELPSEQEFRRCSTEEVKGQLRGLLRFLARLLSASFLLKNAQVVWDKHFSGGRIRGSVVENRILVEILDMEAGRAFWIHVEQYMKTLFEISCKRTLNSSHEQAAGRVVITLWDPDGRKLA